jgi:ATP-dependent RNA helicase DeaD
LPFPDLRAPLARALTERGYAEPTPVQAAVLADEAAGRDLIVSAQTGSGKTVAFGLAFAPELLGEADVLEPQLAPSALVIAPTRELALQVKRELEWLYADAQARVVACVGGMDPKRERHWLSEGAHIVVGTPGRLRDHIERRGLDCSKLAAVVLDEADEMLDMGFREDLEFILQAAPDERRTLMFSATMPKAIAALAQRYQRGALRIQVAGAERGHADIEHRVVRVVPQEIDHVVVNLLRYVDPAGAIVFCNTREQTRRLHANLQERGFSAVLLSGELGQHERNSALQALRDGRARVCVATDVAARGIDLPHVGLVIHADLPHDAESFQHRSGRTGRAGRKGMSALLAPPSRRRRVEQLIQIAGVNPQWSGPPTAEEIEALDHERLMADLLTAEPIGEDEAALADTLLAKRDPRDIAAALVRLYRARLPAPEDVRDPGEGKPLPREKPLRDEPPARMARDESGVWFRLAIGRTKNADPKWLLPMLCRRGDITRQEIGAIRIFPNETKVEVAAAAAQRFAAAVIGDGEEIPVTLLGTDGGERHSPRPDKRPSKPQRAFEQRKHEKPPGKDHGKPPFAGKPKKKKTPKE